jgi:hypothetical protein
MHSTYIDPQERGSLNWLYSRGECSSEDKQHQNDVIIRSRNAGISDRVYCSPRRGVLISIQAQPRRLCRPSKNMLQTVQCG